MSPFKKKNKLGIKKIKSLISSEINLEKIKVNPINVIDKAKNKFNMLIIDKMCLNRVCQMLKVLKSLVYFLNYNFYVQFLYLY